MQYAANLGTQGLADVGATFKDAAGGDIGARITAGIVEQEPGYYVADLTPPAGAEGIYWDSVGDSNANAWGGVRPDNWEDLGIDTDGKIKTVVTNEDMRGTDNASTHTADNVRDAILSDSTPFPGANIDAAVSSRSSHDPADIDTVLSGTHGGGSWEPADVSNIPTTPEFEARTLPSAEYGTFAEQSKILARLGAWTATGVNTILGAFQALMRKDAPDVPDIGGTYLAADDSNEAIRDQGDAAWSGGGGAAPTVEEIDAELTANHGPGSWQTGGAGSGPNAVTITVEDDQGTPLAAAQVLYDENGAGVNTFNGTTNVNGVTSLNVTAGTYQVAITKGGYQFNGATETVTSSKSVTYVITANAIPGPPGDASLCRVYGYVEDLNNQPVEGAEIIFELVSPYPAKSERMIAGREYKATTDANGQITDGTNLYVDLQRNDQITPSGTYYRLKSPTLKFRKETSRLELDSETYDLSDSIK